MKYILLLVSILVSQFEKRVYMLTIFQVSLGVTTLETFSASSDLLYAKWTTDNTDGLTGYQLKVYSIDENKTKTLVKVCKFNLFIVVVNV